MSTGATLAVRLFLSSAGEADDAVIVGDIRPAGLDGTEQHDILIPCGSSPEPTSYAVTPGRYLVTATLPSGLVLTENVTAVEGRRTAVDFVMTDSPYETHSWQYLMGNIEPGRVYHGPTPIPLAESVASRSMVAAAAGPDGVVPDTAVDLAALATWIGDAEPASCSFASVLALRQQPTGLGVVQALARGEPQVLPAPDVRGGALAPLYRFGPHGPLHAPGGAVGERQFLVVEAAGSLRLVTLPLPWGAAEVEVLVNLRQSPTGSAVAVTVRDPVAGAGLAYMSQGALDSAARLFAGLRAGIEEMPGAAPAHPLATAAACYVMLGTDRSPGETYWDAWLEALAEGFPGLSDGAILRAVRTLRRASAPPQLREARDRLIEAFERGVPVYTLGLAWLVDGLSAFPDDPECRHRLDEVRRLSWLADMREPFLILDLRQGST
ncbi:hypothetical protein [Streptomyces sp. NPDC054797]